MAMVVGVDSQGCCSPLLSHMFFVGGVGWGGVAVQGQVGSTIAFRDVWGGVAWQCPGGCCNTQLPEGVPGHQRLRARTVAVQVNHGISPSSTMPGHKHQDHLPLSAIVTVGDFLGGEFCVEEAGLVFPTRGTRPYTMACVAGPEGHDRVHEDGVALDARNGVVFCSGALHMPAPWRGERYALVFFTQVGLGKVSWEDLVLLRSLGFRLCAG